MAERLAAVAFLAVWILVPFWRIATLETVNVQDDVYTSDLLNDRVPARAVVGESLRRGELPLWTRGIYTGMPLFAAVEAGSLYPTNLLLFGLFDPWTAVAWAQLLPLFIAGFGTFVLARELGLDRAPALLAAGAFSLSGFLVSHLRQLNMVDAAAWVPLIFLAVERLSQGRRGALLLAGCWTLQLLAGHPQIAYFTALVAVSFALVRTLGAAVERREALARLGRLALAFGLGGLVAAAALVPGIELATASHRSGGFDFAEASRYAAAPRNFWTFFVPYVNGDPGLGTYRLSACFWEEYGYLGLAPALLAIFAIVVRRGEPVVRVLLVIAVASYLLVLGPSTPVFQIAWRFVPGMAYFRFPTRFLVFVELSVALLAAFGLAELLRGVATARLRGSLAAIVIVATGLDLWTHQMRQVPEIRRSEWQSPIGTVELLRARAAETKEPWRYYSLDTAAVHVATHLAAGGWAGDLSPYVRLRAMLQPSSNLLFGLESPDGYVNLAPRAYETVWGSDKEPGLVIPSGVDDSGIWRVRPAVVDLLRLFNVRWVLAARPVEAEGLRPVGASVEGVAIHEVIDPLPRAFVVGAVRRARTDDEALAIIRERAFDVEREAIVVGENAVLPPDSAPSRDVEIVTSETRHLVLQASLARPGLLVLSEGHYPGWRVAIDGRPAEIVRANLMMRAVVVPAGDHEIAFTFRPRSVAIGFALSALGIVLLVAFRRFLA